VIRPRWGAALAACVVGGLLLPAFPAPTAADSTLSITWSPLAAALVRRTEAGGAVVNGTMYLFGGYISGFVPQPRVDAYDIATNTWRRLADMPDGLTHMGVATDGVYVYIAGGYLPKTPSGQIFASDHVWRFDPAAGSWTAMPPLPSPRGAGALVLVGRTLHYFGGSTIHRKDSATHWTFELDTDTAWQKAAALPNARNHIGGAQLDGLVYAVGGQHGQDAAAVAQSEVDAFDPATGKWTVVAPLPTARSHINASTLTFQGLLIVAGGDPTPNEPTNEVDAFDPGSGTWSTLTPLPQNNYAGVVVDLGPAMMSTTGGTPKKTTLSYEATPNP
jgi:N-acetylneuraminic acid mutarotase